MLSDLSPTNKEREVYETIDADHEYEVLDNYNLQPQYDDVLIPPPKPKAGAEALPLTGDYKFTQCPAYAPVATTSIHGNTSKPAETSSTQPTTIQDDQNTTGSD